MITSQRGINAFRDNLPSGRPTGDSAGGVTIDPPRTFLLVTLMTTIPDLPRFRFVRALVATLIMVGCGEGPAGLGSTLTAGTWGGDDAGLLLSETNAHVHFGCTKGDFPAPIELDEEAHFSVSGEYLIRAYPVAIGPTMPAELAGVVRGNELTLTVAVNDTIDHELVVFGPTTLKLGSEPHMQICPICEMPD